MSGDKNNTNSERIDVAREVLKEGGGDERMARMIGAVPKGVMMVVVVVGRGRGGSHHYHNWTSMSK